MKRLATLLSALFLATAQPFVTPSPAAAETPTPAVAAPPFHVVRPGETIKSIAGAHGIRRRDLRAWNGIVKPNQPSVDGVLNLAKPPAGRLTGWRSWVETVTPAALNWDPAAKCPAEPAELRKVWVTYIDFYGVSHQGSIVVHESIATRTQRAFQALYRMRFRVQGMSPMSLNAPYISDMGTVTAAYSCRRVGGSNTWSQHAYGLAVDVNPVQNPVVRGTPAGTGFQRRDLHRRGMMHADGAVRAFTDQGFYWGGRWNTLKDYMHYSTNDR